MELLERNGLPLAGWLESWNAAPQRPYFLEEEYIRENCRRGEIPDEVRDAALALAVRLRGDVELKRLAWHCYRCFCELPEFRGFPDHIDLFGAETGLFHLLVGLALYPHLKARMEREGLPVELADAAMTRLAPLLPLRSVVHPGEAGLRGRALGFMLNYKNLACFRLGRFDFVLSVSGVNTPELFRRGAEYVMLCRSDWRVGSDGYLLAADADVPGTELKFTATTVTGRRIDPATGRVTPELVTLELSQYERLLPEHTPILVTHIPGGGGMTVERCRDSFRRARSFFSRYYGDYAIAAIHCVSWILNPAWMNYLPDGNLACFQRKVALFPYPAVPKSGLSFVFGREDGDPASYPRDNSMRRVMLRALAEEGTLRSGGMVLPWDEIDRF